ncbi:NTP transferase domain-containing protein [Candidatus Neomarinimicrobiota bacterium]
MNTKNTCALILAAGKGTRMGSSVTKVLNTILDKSIIEYVVDAVDLECIDRIGIVVSPHNIKHINKVLKNRVDYIIQKEPRGTGHAVLAAEKWLNKFEGSVVVLVGDAPFIKKTTILKLVEKQQTNNSAVCFLSTIFKEPPPWGRVIRDKSNNVIKIVEEFDATVDEKKIKEVSSSHYCFNWNKLKNALHNIGNTNRQGEYYLPDAINLFALNGYDIQTITTTNTLLGYGINTLEDLKFVKDEMAKGNFKHE